MTTPVLEFRAPSGPERILNRVFGFLIGIGIGPAHIYLLRVRGRKSGRIFSTPVDPLDVNGKKFLVAPRGRTQWVRNAEAAGEITLKKGSKRNMFRLGAVEDREKAAVVKAYLDAYKKEVQRFFPVPAGSPVEAFSALVGSYPTFELLPSQSAPL